MSDFNRTRRALSAIEEAGTSTQEAVWSLFKDLAEEAGLAALPVRDSQQLANALLFCANQYLLGTKRNEQALTQAERMVELRKKAAIIPARQDALEQGLEALCTQIADAEREEEKLAAREESLQTEKNRLEARRTQIQERNAAALALEEENRALRSELDQLKSVDIAALEQEKAALEEKKATLEAECRRSGEECETLRAAVEQQEQEKQTLESECAALRSQRDTLQGETEERSSLAESLRTELSALQSAQRELGETEQSLQSKLTELRESVSQLRSSNDRLQGDTLPQLGCELDALRSEKKRLETEAAARQQEKSALQTSTEALQRELSALLSRQEELRESKTELEMQKAAAELELRNLDEQRTARLRDAEEAEASLRNIRAALSPILSRQEKRIEEAKSRQQLIGKALEELLKEELSGDLNEECRSVQERLRRCSEDSDAVFRAFRTLIGEIEEEEL